MDEYFWQMQYDYEKQLFQKVLHKKIDKIYDINPNGCENCFKGYKGRICIAEVLNITDDVRTAITNAESKDIMRKLVYINGHTHTLLEDGLEKIVEGETSFEEIYKVVSSHWCNSGNQSWSTSTSIIK